MITIKSDPVYITITRELDIIPIKKDSIGGIKERNTHVVIMTKEGNTWMDIDYTSGVTIDGVVQTTLSMFIATLTDLVREGEMQTFLSTAGQTVFTTAFTCDATTCRIYDNGSRSSLTGWTFPAGVPTYAAGIAINHTIIIERI